MRHIDLPDFDKAAFAGRYGPWAVIAGASDGSGAAFAEQLAAMGVNVVLVSRRSEVLTALGERLAARHGIAYRAIVADLTQPASAERIMAETIDLDVGLYVSNAGVGGISRVFLDIPIEEARSAVQMNAVTLIEAVHGFGRRFRERGRGGIVIMASGAGLGGQPLFAIYSSTKAFEIVFAEAIWGELKGAGVDVITIAAPTMDTPTMRRGREGQELPLDHAYVASEVVHVTLERLGKEPLVIFPEGPDADRAGEIQTARRRRLEAMVDWSEAYVAARRSVTSS